MRTPHRGQKLKESILALGIKTTYLANALGINRVTLYAWYADPNLGIDKIKRISQVLKIDLSTNFPEFLVLNDPVNNYSVDENQNSGNSEKQLLEIYRRYINLLEEHNELMKKYNSLKEKQKGS